MKYLVLVIVAIAIACCQLVTAAEPPKATRATLVVITAEAWCQPCRQMAPIVKRLKQSYAVVVIDVDAQPEIAKRWAKVVPTFVAVKGDREMGRKTGLVTYEVLVGMLETKSN